MPGLVKVRQSFGRAAPAHQEGGPMAQFLRPCLFLFLGEHTEEVLRTVVGFDDQEIAAVRQQGAICGGAQLVKYNLLILGASYGSLFSTKVLMAGHRVTLVCTK